MQTIAGADRTPGPVPAIADERAGIAAFLAGASLELSSRDPYRGRRVRRASRSRNARVYQLPPGQTYHGSVALAARLARAGFRPVPHVAARRIASREALDDFLARVAGEAGVDSALVIGGDSESTGGAFDSSLALLETGLFQRHGIVHIGVAGYPEGHPASRRRLSKPPWPRRAGSRTRPGSSWAS